MHGLYLDRRRSFPYSEMHQNWVIDEWPVTQPELDFRPVNGIGGLRKPRIPDGEGLLLVGTVLR
jgi:hypothetical protein